jgi:hypothetical protein
MTTPTTTLQAEAIIDALVAQAKLDHPTLGLSYGYIGNMERWGDDRDFRVFTNRREQDGRSVSYPLGGLDDLVRSASRMAEYFPRFLARAAALDRRC